MLIMSQVVRSDFLISSVMLYPLYLSRPNHSTSLIILGHIMYPRSICNSDHPKPLGIYPNTTPKYLLMTITLQ